ncbi:toxin-antitoxin system HicB family antitoxin [Ruania suaedae]|uniref:toxin-antitoxin system HicB family antitoxin n=1 Tax=Ruania suaedae TaxID=2897774 RepID=UPI001E2D9177|nr:toxin-antitoxin system HicB family antitoxin [Ruania suaedae]UFU02060.1 toxin-antitoxin system HicB family antitoxin [Ruania suaedae]
MELNGYLASLQQALDNAAQSSAPEVREASERLAQTLEPALRLTLMELASDVAADVTLRLDGVVVDVRLRGGGPEIVVEQQPSAEPPPAPPTPPDPPEDDGSTTRITLRVPDSLKSRVDAAASRDGVSVNSWLVRAVQHALTGPATDTTARFPGRRMTGWVR